MVWPKTAPADRLPFGLARFPSLSRTTVRPVPIHLTPETIESGGPVEARDLFRSATPENEVAIGLDLRDSPMKSRCRRVVLRNRRGAPIPAGGVLVAPLGAMTRPAAAIGSSRILGSTPKTGHRRRTDRGLVSPAAFPV